jgi:hypothetical protein
MGNEKRTVFWKYFESITSLLAIASIIYWYSLWIHYANTRPRIAEVGSGRVITLNTHGLVVYLTAQEKLNLDVLIYLTVGFALSAVLVDVAKGPFRRH